MKIAIVGYSGSGKSTLARKLGAYYKAEVLHFDTVQFLPNWQIRSLEEKKKITKEFMDIHESWIIEGNYSSLYYERRMEEADMIIMLLFNRFRCLHRVIKRYLKYRDRTRPDMGKGCKEKLDKEFVWWILYGGRTKTTKERYKNIYRKYKNKTCIIKNQKTLDAWISENINS